MVPISACFRREHVVGSPQASRPDTEHSTPDNYRLMLAPTSPVALFTESVIPYGFSYFCVTALAMASVSDSLFMSSRSS